MSITSIVGHDGSVRIDLDGHEMKLREEDVDTARARVLEQARNYAAATNEIQRLTASDPAGYWEMFVYPAGDIVPAPARSIVTAPTAPELPVLAPVPVAPRPLPAPAPAPAPGPALAPAPEEIVESGESPRPAASAPALHWEPEAEFATPADEDTAVDEEHTVMIRRAPQRSIVVSFDDGGEEVVAVPAVVGRQPAPRPRHAVLVLTSPGREVSRTHLVVDVDDLGRLTVTDQGAANGTYLNGDALAAGVPALLPDDALLELGDVALRISHAEPQSLNRPRPLTALARGSHVLTTALSGDRHAELNERNR